MSSHALILYYIKGLLGPVPESSIVGDSQGSPDHPPETGPLEEDTGTDSERSAEKTAGQPLSPRPQLSTLALTRLHALLASRGCTQPVLTPVTPGEGLN